MTVKVLIVAAVLAMVGCQSWHGEAEVWLKDGTRVRCPSGLTFLTDGVYCEGSGVSVKWKQVAGFGTR